MANVYRVFANDKDRILKNPDLNGVPQERTIVAAAHMVDNYNRDVLDLDLQEEEGVPAGWKTKLVATKRLVRQIAEATGEPDFDNWSGLRVELFPCEVEGGGKTWPVIGARKAGE